MIALTVEQHQAIVEAVGQPVRVEDPQTKATYVLLKAEVYERIQGLLETDDLTPSEMTPLLWDVMKEDWGDPSMDVYDHYPESS